MSEGDYIITSVLLGAFFLVPLLVLAILGSLRNEDDLGLAEETTYDVARAAEIALASPVVERRALVTSVEMHEILYDSEGQDVEEENDPR